MLLGATYFFPSSIKYRLWSRLRTIIRAESAEEPDLGRTETAKAGWIIMRKYPIFGVGFGGFVSESIRIAAVNPNIMITDETGLLPHNLYVEAGAELGIVGLIIYVMLVFCAFRDLKRAEIIFLARKDEFLFVVASSLQLYILLFLFTGIFSGILTSRIFWMILPLSITLNRIALSRLPETKHKKNKNMVRI